MSLHVAHGSKRRNGALIAADDHLVTCETTKGMDEWT